LGSKWIVVMAVALGVTGVWSIADAEVARAQEETPSVDEIWENQKRQEKVIAEQQEKIRELNEKLEATGERVEAVSESKSASSSDGAIRNFLGRTSLGGYGELHMNQLENDRYQGKDKREIDFHRFVLFVGHDFTDDIRFYSELELEHAISSSDADGEIELEQAFIQFDLSERLAASGGLFLIPVGILNETHEPPTFFGVERNPVEKNVIPSTWWEGGGSLNGRHDNGMSWDVAVTSAIHTDGDFNIRKGRQKVSNADASSFATTSRLAYRGVPGLEVAATFQVTEDIAGARLESTPATLFETHVDFKRNGFGLRALYARWDLFSDDAEDRGQDEQYGFYVEPSYRFWRDKLGVFARFSQWNNAAGSDGGESRYRQYDVGINYWPHPQIVLKFDYQDQDAPTGKDGFDGYNVGIGYQF
jgi:hypothetical protein